MVVEGEGPPLFGRNWLEVFKLDWSSIKALHSVSSLENLLRRFKDLFQGGLGTMKDIAATLTLKEGSCPKFCRARPVPYALREAIDLERLQHMGVIEKISHSDWATPVPKPDGSVRLCGDLH